MCTWEQTYEGGPWEPSCDEAAFALDEGTPKENGMAFCFYCGQRLTEKPWKDDPEGDE